MKEFCGVVVAYTTEQQLYIVQYFGFVCEIEYVLFILYNEITLENQWCNMGRRTET